MTKANMKAGWPQSDNLKAYMSDHDYGARRMGNLLGISGSAVSSYLKEGRAPKPVIMAVEALRRRESGANDKPFRLMLVSIPTGKEGDFRTLLKVADGHVHMAIPMDERAHGR